ncbi:MAG: sigma-70 factor domain-containing protein, partial [Thermodesulfobacteriota bacterium]|nr:sigma-70 factor domain-containing protein [Thermodesulfobacteriota bacterium]
MNKRMNNNQTTGVTEYPAIEIKVEGNEDRNDVEKIYNFKETKALHLDSIKMYLREIASTRILGKNEEGRICKRIEMGRKKLIKSLIDSQLTIREFTILSDLLEDGKANIKDFFDDYDE